MREDLTPPYFPYGLAGATKNCVYGITIDHLHVHVVGSHVTGSFVVGHQRRATCQQSGSPPRTTRVKPGRFALVIGCESCAYGTFQLTSGVAPTLPFTGPPAPVDSSLIASGACLVIGAACLSLVRRRRPEAGNPTVREVPLAIMSTHGRCPPV
jgi:hypothetical protein